MFEYEFLQFAIVIEKPKPSADGQRVYHQAQLVDEVVVKQSLDQGAAAVDQDITTV